MSIAENRSHRRLVTVVRPLVAAALVVLVAGVTAGCTAPDDELSGSVRAEYWRPNIQGELSITKGSKPGTASSTSVRRDLGLDHADAPVFGADVDYGRHRLSFEYLGLSLSGTEDLGEAFIFHGQTFPAGDTVNSNLNVPTSSLTWSYALWKEGANAWRAGLGGRLWTFDLRVDDPQAGLSESRKFSGFYPLVASDLSLDLTRGLFLRLGGNVAAVSTSQAIYEAAGALGWNAEKHFGAELGWRFLRYDFNESTNDGDFNLSGPYIAVRFLF